MVDQLHSENFHLMISVWPFFEPGSAVYDDMEKSAAGLWTSSSLPNRHITPQEGCV